jgi:hypothetical protein
MSILISRRCRWTAIICLFLFITASPLKLFSQQLEVKHVEFKSGLVSVHYSLRDSVVGRVYTVWLYASRDNFLSPLLKISGDAGLEVKPGTDNTILWDARGEFGADFEGKVSLEVRGRLFIPFINTESINQYKVFKRGRKYNITWSGGSSQNILNFDLYRGDRKVTSYPNIANVGYQSIEFPSHVKPGKGYRFRISDSKNKEDVVYSQPFKIKRKIPLALKLLPLLGVGYVFYSLSGKDIPDDAIPDPPASFPGNE